MILDLDARGFSNEDFRDSVGYALMRRAGNESGLPDEICKLLERWLASSCPPADNQLEKENENDTDKPRAFSGSTVAGMRCRTAHTCSCALTYGLLRREPALLTGG